MAKITLTVLGARGSMPVSGDAFSRFGGHTTSFAVSTATTTVFVDAGTAFVAAADLELDHWQVLFTHYHNDHLQGLHFFPPLFAKESEFRFFGFRPEEMSLEAAINASFDPPFFPIALTATPSGKEFVELSGEPLALGDIDIATARLNHPQGAAAYRFEHGGSSIVIATDHEAGDAEIDQGLQRLARDADVLVHDAQYTPEDYEGHEGWGHSTWQDAVAVAVEAGVKQLVLTSHDPGRTDDEIDAIVARARSLFPLTSAAYEGMVATA